MKKIYISFIEGDKESLESAIREAERLGYKKMPVADALKFEGFGLLECNSEGEYSTSFQCKESLKKEGYTKHEFQEDEGYKFEYTMGNISDISQGKTQAHIYCFQDAAIGRVDKTVITVVLKKDLAIPAKKDGLLGRKNEFHILQQGRQFNIIDDENGITLKGLSDNSKFVEEIEEFIIKNYDNEEIFKTICIHNHITKEAKEIKNKYRVGDYVVSTKGEHISYIKIGSIRFNDEENRFEYNVEYIDTDDTYTCYIEENLRTPTQEELNKFFR